MFHLGKVKHASVFAFCSARAAKAKEHHFDDDRSNQRMLTYVDKKYWDGCDAIISDLWVHKAPN